MRTIYYVKEIIEADDMDDETCYTTITVDTEYYYNGDIVADFTSYEDALAYARTYADENGFSLSV